MYVIANFFKRLDRELPVHVRREPIFPLLAM